MSQAQCPHCGGTSYGRLSQDTVQCFGCATRYILPEPAVAGILQAPNAVQTVNDYLTSRIEGTVPPPVAHVCATCRFWGGTISSFQAACSHAENMGTRPPFDGTCRHWAAGKTE